MKKIISLLLALFALVMLLTACSPKEEDASDDDYTIKVASLKGPTSIGMVKLMSDCQNGDSPVKCDFTIAGSADEITPKLSRGEFDIVSVPANLTSVLYNNSSEKVKILAINTLGVVYIMNNGDSVNSFADLAGKTIYATGKGSVPEYALTYLLAQNGLTLGQDVNVEWKSEPTEIVALMQNQEDIVAMVPQPYVTVLQSKVQSARIAIDLNDEWNKTENGSKLITSVIAARESFINEHPELVKAFLDSFEGSAAYVVNNVESAAKLVGEFDIVAEAVAKKAIPYCNIVCIRGNEMKTALKGFFGILYDLNPKALGGQLPDDGIFYEG